MVWFCTTEEGPIGAETSCQLWTVYHVLHIQFTLLVIPWRDIEPLFDFSECSLHLYTPLQIPSELLPFSQLTPTASTCTHSDALSYVTFTNQLIQNFNRSMTSYPLHYRRLKTLTVGAFSSAHPSCRGWSSEHTFDFCTSSRWDDPCLHTSYQDP